jgi:RNA polymerase sigma-70 factor, ECF subfamily
MDDAKCSPNVAQLVAEHHAAAYRYAYRLTGSVQDAEDLTQDVFLVAQRKVGQLREIDNTRAWLFAVLRNCFLKQRQHRRPALAVNVSLDMDLVLAPEPSEAVDRDRLQEALNQLPDAARMVVVMYYFEECSYREIAERLDIPIGTVMSRLARAKGHLRSILFEPEHGRRKRPASVAAKQG